jgi:hypothetical protein
MDGFPALIDVIIRDFFLTEKCYKYISRLFNKPLIHVIGDSHTRIFKGGKFVILHPIGPATAFNLGSKKSTNMSNYKLQGIINSLNSNDKIIMVLGEIDCRIHIYYQYKKAGDISINELIDNTISNYEMALNQIHGFELYVCSTPPEGSEDNIYKYAYYADRQLRRDILLLFNDKLKEMCNRNGYKYIDIFYPFCDNKGYLLEKYAEDSIHLNLKAKRELRKILIETEIKI